MDPDFRKKMRQRRQKREWAQQRRRREKDYLQQLIEEHKELGQYNTLLKDEIEKYRNLERQQLMTLCHIRTYSLSTDSCRRKSVGSTSELLVESIVLPQKPYISRHQSQFVVPKSGTLPQSASSAKQRGPLVRQMSEGLLGGSATAAVSGIYSTLDNDVDAVFCDGDEMDGLGNGDGFSVTSSQGSLDAEDAQSSVSSIGSVVAVSQLSISRINSTASLSQSHVYSFDTNLISPLQSSSVRLARKPTGHRQFASPQLSIDNRDKHSLTPRPMANTDNNRSFTLSEPSERNPGFVPLTPLCRKPASNVAITVTSTVGHTASWSTAVDASEITTLLEAKEGESNKNDCLSRTVRERNWTAAQTTTTSHGHIHEKHNTTVPQPLSETKRDTISYKTSHDSGHRTPVKAATNTQVAMQNIKSVSGVSIKATQGTPSSPFVGDPDIDSLLEAYGVGTDVDVFDI